MVPCTSTRHGSPSPSRRRTRLISASRRSLGGALALASVLVLTLLGAGPAWAAAATTPAAKDPESLPIPEGKDGPVSVADGVGGTMLRLTIGLIVVVGLIAAVWYVMKRVQRSRYPAIDERGPSLIDVVSTTSLGPSRSLHLVRVGEELVLVGATDGSVTPLARLGAEDAAELVDLGPAARRAHGPGMDDRARAAATATADASLVDRLRALTTRR
jgi:flagellar biosynthetic protein FliO